MFDFSAVLSTGISVGSIPVGSRGQGQEGAADPVTRFRVAASSARILRASWFPDSIGPPLALCSFNVKTLTNTLEKTRMRGWKKRGRFPGAAELERLIILDLAAIAALVLFLLIFQSL